MRALPFLKMHGLGNDFVVIDARAAPRPLTAAQLRWIADRRLGIGCDQIVTIEPADAADAFMRIHNADGSESGACGNAARCVARWLAQELGRPSLTLMTGGGKLDAACLADGLVRIDMGPAREAWREIPLARAVDTLHVPLALGPLADPVATSLGNPHVTFFVANAEEVDLTRWGPQIEHDPLFPERVNVGVAQVLSPERLRLRVWERGAGLTRACGTGACAAAVAAARRGLTGRRVTVALDGGELVIDWRADGHVLMTGPGEVSFAGEIDPARLTAIAGQ
ncbi:MAG: diaminopimelate epimerase [Alphaproteobacteria bacterium]|nr:diaminopimelate epimerase [Alphaproteobacteria bacterium]